MRLTIAYIEGLVIGACVTVMLSAILKEGSNKPLTLLDSIAIVESNNNNNATGDEGRAAGCLQIHACVVADVNRVYKTNFTWPEDCFNKDKSYRIAKLYLAYWGVRTGHDSEEELARIWNGGPRGYAKDATNSYWNKVKKELKE